MTRGLSLILSAFLACWWSGPAASQTLDGKTGGTIAESTFRARVQNADILLIGEVHDNPAHHAGQAEIMSLRFATATSRPSVVFEMLSRDAQSTLNSYDGGPERFAEAVGWVERGWPDPAIYAPVFHAAFDGKAHLIGGDLPRPTIRTLHSTRAEALEPEIRAFYDSLSPLPDSVAMEMTDIQFHAHCELMPRAHLAGMVTVQRARDAALAEAVAAAFRRTGGPVVLIAGAGHVRTDHGVGKLLQIALPQADILVIGFAERDRWEGAPAPYDIVRVTDGVDRPDPCESLKRRIEGNGTNGDG